MKNVLQFLSSPPLMVVIVFLVIIETFAISLLKMYNETNNVKLLLFACLLYPLLGFIFAKVIKEKGVAIGNAMWQITTIILVSLWGNVYFKESIDIYERIGLLFGVVSVFLFNKKYFI